MIVSKIVVFFVNLDSWPLLYLIWLHVYIITKLNVLHAIC